MRGQGLNSELDQNPPPRKVALVAFDCGGSLLPNIENLVKIFLLGFIEGLERHDGRLLSQRLLLDRELLGRLLFCC